LRGDFAEDGSDKMFRPQAAGSRSPALRRMPSRLAPAPNPPRADLRQPAA
jgi:hypothetical protein